MIQFQSAAGSSDETHHAKRAAEAPAEWQRAHDELLRLAHSRSGLDFEEGSSMTKTRCCSWLARCSRALMMKGAGATNSASRSASTVSAESKTARANRRPWGQRWSR
jgi:hypothetical protein